VAATLFCAPQSAKVTVINGKVIVRDGEVVTMDLKPVIESHNRCAVEMANV
jgi:8-oxoguanine deaminase